MSSEDFKSFIVTDPDIVDEGIDISGIKRTTDTSPLLLGDLEPGLRYDPTLQSTYSDLLQYFSGGLPMLPETPVVTPPATGGGGSGGGGSGDGEQATLPGFEDTAPESIAGFDPGVTPGPSGFIGLDSDMDVDPFQFDDAQTYEPSTTPQTGFLPSGAAGGASLTDLDLDNIDLGNPTGDSRIVSEEQGLTGKPSMLGDTGGSMDQMSGVQQENFLQNVFNQAGQTVEGALTELSKIPGAIVDKFNETVDVFGKKINVGKTLAGLAINRIVGGPVSLVFEALPERDPRQNKLDEFYDVKDGTIQSGLMAGYNPVSGNPLNPTFGLQDAYQKRIDTINKTLAKQGDSPSQELIDRRDKLIEEKKKEADILGITTTMPPAATTIKDDSIKIEELKTREEQQMLDEITVEEIANISDRQPEVIEQKKDELAAIYDREVERGERKETPTVTSDINKAKAVINMPQMLGDVGGSMDRRDEAKTTLSRSLSTTKPGTSGGSDSSSSNGGKSIVCTAMYQTTGLEDWSKAMKIWYIYQKRYLTIQHQEGYHKLFKPFVIGMHKSKIIKAIGAHVAKHRTQHLKHVMFNSKPSLLGKIYNKILEPICYFVGKNG